MGWNRRRNNEEIEVEIVELKINEDKVEDKHDGKEDSKEIRYLGAVNQQENKEVSQLRRNNQ